MNMLPPNATPLERAIEALIHKRFNAINIPIKTLWNPDTCPHDLLPWLAWANSVDIWDDGWSDAIKRETIRQSYFIHRHKGTIGSVRRALAALNIGIEISEWFENGDAPGTFRLDAFADNIFDAGFGINAALLNMISSQIDTVKRASAHYQVRIGERFTSDQYIRTASRHKVKHNQDMDPMPFEQKPLTRCYIRQAIKHKFVHKYYHNIATTNIGAFA